MPNKLRFLARIIRHRVGGQIRVCPYCKEPTQLEHLARKKFILEVFHCPKCCLIFRWPLDTNAESEHYYQRAYSKSAPYVRLPSEAKLRELRGCNFTGSPLDRSAEIAIVKTVRPQGRVLDYGCSWGFAVHQFIQSGFSATGFEISKPRAKFGREKLGADIVDDFAVLNAMNVCTFDIIYSHQVLKNLADIRAAFDVMHKLLKPGGLMFHVVPNFAAMLAENGTRLNWIGEEHPIAPTRDFFEYALPRSGFQNIRVVSNPFARNLGLSDPAGNDPAVAESDLLVMATRE
ncbi:MAG TPA: methyltransferase domain-containing protein [Candidatus Acidoferrales bacterium]|nr:methyltransferase domain-containing protein [Candidatus Acidoferrales bacterium]